MIDITPGMVTVTVSRGRTLVGGKVMPMADLEKRDAKLPQPSGNAVGAQENDFLFSSNGDDQANRTRDKALLVALGVDGNVPLAQAATGRTWAIDVSAMW